MFTLFVVTQKKTSAIEKVYLHNIRITHKSPGCIFRHRPTSVTRPFVSAAFRVTCYVVLHAVTLLMAIVIISADLMRLIRVK